MKNIILFAYDFPHRKTHDFIVDLVSNGLKNLVVLGASKKKLDHVDTFAYFDGNLKMLSPINTSALCEQLGIPFYNIEHDDEVGISEIVSAHDVQIAIISGARIIKGNIIALFSRGVVNFHPGKVPETSGLDAFFYALKKNVTAGVTTHFIDHRVDAGFQLFFDEAYVGPSTTPEMMIENIYQLQRYALRRFIKIFKSGEDFKSCPIDRPVKNEPMSSVEKFKVISHFSSWRASRFIEQEYKKLLIAINLGEMSNVSKILVQLPELLNKRNENGWTPLIMAAYLGNLELVQLMIELGANPNDSGLKGTTVLMYAKTHLINNESSDYGLLDFLILSGADIYKEDMYKKNIIDYVAESGDQKMLDYFKNKKA
jgi:hypothetical protein